MQTQGSRYIFFSKTTYIKDLFLQLIFGIQIAAK